ncbi:MAG: SAM-dependent chlorinase/fluorinase [Spirochaetaceae bacterium]|jgi:protein tyrosine/serine phosphatase|nr:SAM-dependent chlorinase/fluorinase [Spirochaetaceae bacterium]
MKKVLIKERILGSVLVLVLAACVSAKAPEVSYPDFSGEAVSVSKYGNVLTDISAAAIENAGYEMGDVLIIQSEGIAEEVPYVSAYSDVDRGNLLAHTDPDSGQIELAISYGNLSERLGIVLGSAVTLKMAVKGAYLSEFEIRHLEKSESRSDYASDEVFANFREIRTGSIRARTLYRSCNPILGDARAPYAVALAEAAEIKTIINLADSDEELAQRGPSSPWYDSLIRSGNVVNLNMGVDFQSPDFPEKLKKALQFLIASEGPYLIHCNEGKDRAGIVSALLEGLAGAKLSDIKADYMVSYANYYGVTPNEARYAAIANIIVDILKEMNKGGAVTDRNLSQVIENYLTQNVGLSAQEISQIRSRLR